MVPTGAMDYIDDTVLQAAATAYGLSHAALPVYRANRPGASPGDILAAVSGDWFFRIPALRVAEARTQSPTWVYEFAWTTPQHGGRLGACHYADLAFAFDTLQSEGADWLLGSQPPQTSPTPCTAPGLTSHALATPAGTATPPRTGKP